MVSPELGVVRDLRVRVGGLLRCVDVCLESDPDRALGLLRIVNGGVELSILALEEHLKFGRGRAGWKGVEGVDLFDRGVCGVIEIGGGV